MAGFQITEIVEVGPGWNKVRLSDGNVYTLDGNYNWRSNNPGNIEWGDFARSQGAIGPGAVPPGRQRAFAIFPTYEQGRQAKENLLFNTPAYLNAERGGYAKGSIGSAIHRYAPPSENETDGFYIANVAAALGVDPNTKLTDLTPEQRVTMLNTMERVEGYAVGDMFNEAGIKLPPAEIPNVVASALDTSPVLGKRNVLSTTPSGIDEAYRYTNTATGDLLPNQAIPAPAMRQGLIDTLKQGPEYRVLLPELQPSTLDRNAIPQSGIERTQMPAAAPQGLLGTLGASVPQSGIERGTPRNSPQGSASRGLLGMLGSNAGDDLALNSTAALGGYGPDLMDAAYDERTGAMVRVEPVNTYGMGTFNTPAPSPSITERNISPTQEQAMIYRNGGPTRPQPAAPRADPVGQGAGGFGNLATLLGTNRPQQPANPPSGVFQTTTPALAGSVLMPANYRPQVNIPAMPTQDDPQSGADWSDFTGTFRPSEPKPDWIPLGDVMSPRPPAPAIAANPPARPISPTPPRPATPAAPTYRTVMQPTQVENPAYTAWKAANLGASNKPIPLGDVMNPRSRDSVANAAAGANFVATQMPAQWITVQKPVQVAVTPPRQIAAPPVIAPPVAPPAQPFQQQPMGGGMTPGVMISKGAGGLPGPMSFRPRPQQAPAAPRGLLDFITGAAAPVTGLLGSLVNPAPNNSAPTSAIAYFKGLMPGISSADAYTFANATRNNMPVADRLSDGASGGGDIGRGPSIDRVAGPHVAALHRR